MRVLDVRQDGLIEYDEFVASVAAEQSKLTDAKLQAAFSYMDSDSDGVVSTGELAGFKNLESVNPEAASHRQLHVLGLGRRRVHGEPAGLWGLRNLEF